VNAYQIFQQQTFRIFIATVLITMVILPIFGSNGWGSRTPVGGAEKLSDQEKQGLVQKAVEQYQQGNHDQARESFELAKTVFPENYAAPYYLGLIYLEQGKRAEAIGQWRQYVKMDPKSENALRIRKNLTLLLKAEARESAQIAVANESAMIRMPTADNTVAVSAFKNMGSENIQLLGKGMAALLIHDLSLVPDLQVVERVKLQALLGEMKLGTSGLVSAESAPRVGKLLKARHVTSGSLADLEEDRLQIASALVNADEIAQINTQQAQGELKEFYDLEKQIACQIVEDMGKDCDRAPAAFHDIHTKSLPALIFFAAGLDYLDRENYDRARSAFQKAIERDPAFQLAQQKLLETPVAEMQFMKEDGSAGIGTNKEMIAMAASQGPAADVAGAAVTAEGGHSAQLFGGMGVGPIAGIAGGAAVAGVALAGGSSSSSSDSGGVSPGGEPAIDVADAAESDFVGTYNATAQDRTYDQWHGQLTLNDGGSGSYLETIDGEQHSGTLTWGFDASNNTLSFTTDGGAHFSGTATGVLNNFTLNGTWASGSPGTIQFVRQP
jgi:tetratricopeptide (TPR) repeat protein